MPAPVVRTASCHDSRRMQLRESDVREVAAISDHDSYTAFELSRVRSDFAYTVLLDNTPIAMFGVAQNRLRPDWGSPWLLATDRLASISIAFLRQSQFYVSQMFDRYRVLQNWVHHENTLSIAWLKWLGFHFVGPYPLGKHDEMFYEFLRVKQ